MSATNRDVAAGEVLRVIADKLATLDKVLCSMWEHDMDTIVAVAEAASALTSSTGALADRAACALGSSPAHKSPDQWTLGKGMSDVLQALEGGK